MPSISPDLVARGAGRVQRVSARLQSEARVAAAVALELKQLLRNPDVRPLPQATVATIRRYARERFGSAGYAPWLIFYATMRGRFVEGWVPSDFFMSVAIRRINGAYHMADNARTLQYRLMGPGVLPDIAHFVSGEWRSVDGALLDRSRIADLLFEQGEKICIKAQESSKGLGVRFATRSTFDLSAVEATGNFVVQPAIRQAESYDRFFPDALNTVRVSTAKLPGQRPRALFGFLRTGLGNARHIASDWFDISVVDDDGTFDRRGWDPARRWSERHPDTGFVFAGERLSEYRRLVDYCIALHDRIPQFGFVGWDVCVDREGEPRLLEINTGFPGIKFAEMTVGPCLRCFNVEQYARPGPA